MRRSAASTTITRFPRDFPTLEAASQLANNFIAHPTLMWSDSIGVALVAFVVAGAIHSINHALDRHLGGHPLDQWELAGLVLVALAALIVHVWGGSRQEE
jgi:hypothetical protein